PVAEEFARVWHADGWRINLGGEPHALPRHIVRSRMLRLFCPHYVTIGPNGEREWERQSTTDLSVAEFSAMLDEIAEYLVHKDGEKGMMPDTEGFSG
ncbi:MAG: hypothetical protein HKO53_02775, partial [Gemmatimonadetes bacterium]|nr:hypothetical protein [Gemmatimonadota bacterium]